jgi:hypothetical protein
MTSDYGIHRLSFTPPDSTGDEDYPNIAINMATGGDASVPQMLRFFEAYLAAAGYILKGELQVVEPEETPSWQPNPIFTPNKSIYDFGDDGFSFTGNPYAAPDTICFSGVRGGMAQDILTLG